MLQYYIYIPYIDLYILPYQIYNYHIYYMYRGGSQQPAATGGSQDYLEDTIGGPVTWELRPEEDYGALDRGKWGEMSGMFSWGYHWEHIYYIILYYTILYYITLFYIILYYIILYYVILYYIILYYIILHYFILSYLILYYIIIIVIILSYIILYYLILYYIIFHFILFYFILVYSIIYYIYMILYIYDICDY
jgi:hypothetical protein